MDQGTQGLANTGQYPRKVRGALLFNCALLQQFRQSQTTIQQVNGSDQEIDLLIRGIYDLASRVEAIGKEVTQGIQRIGGVVQDQGGLKETLRRMIDQSSVSKQEIEKILLSLQSDITFLERP